MCHWTHWIIEQPRLEETSKHYLVQPFLGKGALMRPFRTLSSHRLKASGDRDSATSLGKLSQWLVVLTVNNLFILSRWNLAWSNLSCPCASLWWESLCPLCGHPLTIKRRSNSSSLSLLLSLFFSPHFYKGYNKNKTIFDIMLLLLPPLPTAAVCPALFSSRLPSWSQKAALDSLPWFPTPCGSLPFLTGPLHDEALLANISSPPC